MKKLKFRILFFMIATGVVGFLALAFNVANEKVALERVDQDILKLAASSIIDKLDRNLFERYGDVQAYALSDPARSGDAKRITAFMNDMMPTYAPIYDMMIMVNAHGKVIAANTVNKAGNSLNTSSVIGKDFSETTWFKKNISGEIKAGVSYVEDLHIDSDTANIVGSDGSIMAFSTPVRNAGGKIVGVWRNYVSWKDVVGAMLDEESKKLNEVDFPTVLPYLISSSGLLLFSTENKQGVLKETFLSAQELATASKPTSRTTSVSGAIFSGEVWEAMVASKGYSSYPGIGWRMAVQVPSADPDIDRAVLIGGISFGILMLVVLAGYVFVSSVTTRLSKINEQLVGSANGAMSATISIKSAADSLASAVGEQAAAVQETAASMEQMNAMVRKSADNAEHSRRSALTSQEAVGRGRTAVQSMLGAMDEINSSNSELAKQVEDSNRKLVEVTKVIGEIGAKTKVINEIVFQTKLLSFNASVEAARAGEHGKGFAVVAEEVGNLAQMSGSAAKEISDLLETSTHRVNDIVTETKTRVESAMHAGRTKVETGVNLARQCDAALEEVVKSVSEVGVMVSEISTATAETSTGLSEISRAIHQIDQATNSNASASNTTADEGKKAEDRIRELAGIAKVLEILVNGKAETFAPIENTSQVVVGKSTVTETSLSTHGAKIVRLNRKAEVQQKTVVSETKVAATGTTGVAVGSTVVPSQDDPRFEDV